jgi:aminopeptidase
MSSSSTHPPLPPVAPLPLPQSLLDSIKKYANLLIRVGLNVQPGQHVQITGDINQTPFLALLKQEAYLAGAHYVYLNIYDVRDDLQRIKLLAKEQISYYPQDLVMRHSMLVDQMGASLFLISNECMELLEESDPELINQLYSGKKRALKDYYQKGIGQSYVQWCVAAAPSVDWGRRIGFSGTDEEVYHSFWLDILELCYALETDIISIWKNHDQQLHRRAETLNQQKITTLHFIGPETDLTVGLCPQSIWMGGSHPSKRQVPFQANIPTQECFTCPNRWEVHGTVKAVRPFEVNGKMIHGLKMRFEKGKVVHFTATSGAEHLEKYLDTDSGGRYLGEVALVPVSSPIFQKNRLYQEILFDENAACHIAVGSAYDFCFQDSQSWKAEELLEKGFNQSSIHTDIMISDEQTQVIAYTSQGQTIELMQKGLWSC